MKSYSIATYADSTIGVDLEPTRRGLFFEQQAAWFRTTQAVKPAARLRD
jgi:hypothetical protein